MPATRSASSLAEAKTEQSIVDAMIRPLPAALDTALQGMVDSEILHSRDAKVLQAGRTNAIQYVWQDSSTQTAILTKKVNEGVAVLCSKLNETYSAVGELSHRFPESPKRPCSFLSGASTRGYHEISWRDAFQRAEGNFLIGCLDGIMRGKVEGLDEEGKKDSYGWLLI
ncbi:unnamed protein product [Heligmosomoides polygyrus]|uniref:Podospora anserina S mat+ genomic DNA chromosome 7, supercontig 1 n=1 Tax=Heligmosomoides polygyrus TaxID=6339 RepID=A0A183GNZ0_HELPZ|nr:unnamed protein product [Heligmosomoides polygyrus]